MRDKRNLRKRRHGPNGCPTDCNGGGAANQQELTPGQFAKLPADVGEQRLRRCIYCGAVYEDYVRSVLGFLDDEIYGPGWHSLKGAR